MYRKERKKRKKRHMNMFAKWYRIKWKSAILCVSVSVGRCWCRCCRAHSIWKCSAHANLFLLSHTTTALLSNLILATNDDNDRLRPRQQRWRQRRRQPQRRRTLLQLFMSMLNSRTTFNSDGEKRAYKIDGLYLSRSHSQWNRLSPLYFSVKW